MRDLPEQNIILDEQFQFLLPTLDDETYRLLEENILEFGVREPLVLWRRILIDGYNRYKICIEHELPFNIVEMEFNSRDEVLIWIISNQISRRNLTSMQLSYFRGLHYEADKKNRGGDNRTLDEKAICQNGILVSGSTATRLAEQYRVSQRTIARDRNLAEALTKIGEISPEAKRKILSGEVPINKSKLESLASAPPEKAEAVATEIEEGTYNRRVARDVGQTDATDTVSPIFSPPTELTQLSTIISNFAKSFDTMLKKHSVGGSLELKSVLRSYIDQLEELYSKV